MADKKATFEENIIELEQIIESLEKGDVPLDKCLSLFENGVRLSKECMTMLDNAEQKIKLLTESESGSILETDFVVETENI